MGYGVEGENKTIVNPSFNAKDKTVTTCQPGPVALKEYRCQKFEFDGETYKPGSNWTEKWEETENDGDTNTTIYNILATSSTLLQITPKYSIKVPLEWRMEKNHNQRGDISYTSFTEETETFSIFSPYFSFSFGDLLIKEESQLQSSIGILSTIVLESESTGRIIVNYIWEEKTGSPGDKNSFHIITIYGTYEVFLKNRQQKEELIKNIHELPAS